MLYIVIISVELQCFNCYDGLVIIMVGNGMMIGGCIQYYFKYYFWKFLISLIIVFYQLLSSFGGCIVVGQGIVYLMGEDVVVCVQVYIIGGFFVYVDQDDLFVFFDIVGKLYVWLVYGEVNVMDVFLLLLVECGFKGDIVFDCFLVDLFGVGFSSGCLLGFVVLL